ncbi:hypothetical protein NP233_g8786 [Leucocoprinus birnbaumii]|uniref:Major facilitator superfamily (MFS) profile domain-containing protein n=1 Tax=Leucocoprinus birnbaumii TaxID=56174 RepID=A0AAD5YNR7_9AGAR|nr:hypothetical protein NP233_g8786 [Leucocoprinus birnbaumii]
MAPSDRVRCDDDDEGSERSCIDPIMRKTDQNTETRRPEGQDGPQLLEAALPLHEYPDGGLRAWGVVLGGFLMQFCSFGYMSAFGVYQDYYTRIYMTAYSPSAIAWIGSTSAFLLFSIGLVVGRLYDRGYCFYLTYGGSIIISLSLFMLSFVKANQYYGAFLCQGIGMGIGGGMIYLPSLVTVSQYFERKRVVAMSIVTAGVSAGAVVSPILLNHLLRQPQMSFATVSRIYAGVVSSLLIPACYLVKPRVSLRRTEENYIGSFIRFSKDPAFVLLTLGLALFGLGVLFPIFFLQLAAIENGLSEDFAFYSLVILNASGFFGRILCAIIGRKVGVDILAIVSIIICGGVVFSFVAISSEISVIFIAIIYGFFWGIFVATCSPFVALLTENMEEMGLRLGTAFAFAGLAELIGPPIMGALLGGYHWWRPAVFSGTILIATGACLAVVHVISRRGKKIHAEPSNASEVYRLE